MSGSGWALLTDGQQRKTLAAARSLSRAGYRVAVADPSRLSLSRFSQASSRHVVSPPPDDTTAYLAWLEEETTVHPYAVVLPMDDLSTEAALAYRGSAATLLPSPGQFRVGRDKWRTVELARSARVRVPATRLADAGVWPRTPGVLRPRRGAGGQGFQRAAHVAPGTHLQGYIWQAEVPVAAKWDVGLLYDAAGRRRAAFVQRELRWFPHPYGASTRQISVHRPDLVELAESLLRPMGWQGPVEVEFLEDVQGALWVSEINPRLWASLALAIRAGVDFPRLWAELAQGREADGPETYRLGIECRWTYPADLLAALGRSPVAPAPAEEVFDDILDRGDRGALWGLLAAAMGHAWRVGFWRQIFRW